MPTLYYYIIITCNYCYILSLGSFGINKLFNISQYWFISKIHCDIN